MVSGFYPASFGVATRPLDFLLKSDTMIITEADYKKIILEKTAMYFHIQKEVTGYFFGNRCRIDAVITPKDNTGWSNKDVSFGIEFKHFSDNRDDSSLNYYTKQFKQIVDYSYTEFNGVGRIPVLICPPLFNNLTGDLNLRQANLLKHVMGQCNVGELFLCKRKGLSIIFNAHHLIWCERYGVCQGKTQQFKPKTGSGSVI